MKPFNSLLDNSLDNLTVNSNKEVTNTVNSNTVGKEIDEILVERGIKPEGVAIKLSEDLSDPDSLNYFNILTKDNRDKLDILLDALSATMYADSLGKIRIKKSVYFLGILRKKGIVVKFKRS